MSFWLLVLLYIVSTNLLIYVMGLSEANRINQYAKIHGRTPIPTYIGITATAPIAYSALITFTLGTIVSKVFKLKLSVSTRTFFVHLSMGLLIMTTGVFQFAFSLVRNVGMVVNRT